MNTQGPHASKGNRWSFSTIHTALKMFIKGGSNCIKKINDMNIITLPSEKTLKLKRYEFQHKQGASVEYLQDFRNRLFRSRETRNSPGEPFLILKYDELYVRNGVVFNPHSLQLMGLTSDFETDDLLSPFYALVNDIASDQDVDKKILQRHSAKMILQTIISDMGSDFNEVGPCWSSAEPMKKHAMYVYLVDGLMLPLAALGLQFQALLSDMSSGNLSFVQLLTQETAAQMANKAITLNIPFYHFKPLFIFDAQHSLKSLRNALFASTFQEYDLVNQCYPLQISHKPITVDHLREMYKQDTSMFVANRTLTEANLWPDAWSKQSVPLCLQIFNHIVLSAMKDEVEYEGTYQYILNASKLLIGTIVAPGRNYQGYSDLTSSNHPLINQMKQAFEYFSKWRQSDPDSFLHVKTYLTISSINYGVQKFCDRFKCHYSTSDGEMMKNVYVCLPRLSTNDVELFFSNVRRLNCDSAVSVSRAQGMQRQNQNMKLQLLLEKKKRGHKRKRADRKSYNAARHKRQKTKE